MDLTKYNRYIEDFNSACIGRKSFSDFYDKYYEPDAIFEYIPKARKNIGRQGILALWE